MSSPNGIDYPTLARMELARRKLFYFAKSTMPTFDETPFHRAYYSVLDEFAAGRIKKLIVSVPPQHGKSQGSTRFLPAFMLGKKPHLKIGLASYSATLAKSFNRDIQKIIDTANYEAIFPNTKINSKRVVAVDSYLRNSEEFDIIDNIGNLKAVGRGGGLTGHPVDVMIMDDLYKDFMEANSPVVRQAAWDWYTTVVKTRLHNDSQEIIVFTRWHEDDIIGRLETAGLVREIKSLKDIDNLGDKWAKVNFEAIKESDPTELDPRELNEVLYAKRHSLKSLEEKRELDPINFGSLYQGDPQPKEGLLYSDFSTYTRLPEAKKKGNYTDTADKGDDYLCSICYDVGKLDGKIYVTDILYTQEAMEITEPAVASMFSRNQTREANIESNNGGRGFARAVEAIVGNSTKVGWFHQSENKESRILTNASTVMNNIVMPVDWVTRFPKFAAHVMTYKKLFKANKYNDAPDTLTGIVEKEVLKPKFIGNFTTL